MRSISLIWLLLAGHAALAAEPAPEAAVSPSDAPPAADAQAVRAARRERFQLHSSLGYLCGGFQLGALVFFGLDDGARFSGGNGSHSYVIPEIAFGSAAEVVVIVNYLLAATAPSQPGGTSVKNIIHQSFMYASAAANVARIVIAVMLASANNASGNEGLVLAHRITAIASPVLFAAGASLQAF